MSLKDLQDYYRNALRKRIREVESGRKVLLCGEHGSADVLRQAAHKLKGSGGTYGFPEITEAAQAVVEACPPRGQPPKEIDRILALVDELLKILERVRSGQ